MTQYCIPQGSRQQCVGCELINGNLYTANNYQFPNCPGTKWVNINPYAGTNGTPVYEVVAMPLDDYIPLLAVAMVLVTFRKQWIKK